jgi:hypothetical protein
MHYEMIITNVFRLSNGSTVLGGEVSCDEPLSAGECALVYDGAVQQKINVLGEMILERRDPANQLRAVETTEPVPLSIEDTLSRRWKLICDR